MEWHSWSKKKAVTQRVRPFLLDAIKANQAMAFIFEFSLLLPRAALFL
jgi:hypothetical protein